MNQGVKVEFKYPCQKLMKGIYKLTIGGKFYIGKAKRLAKRAYQHQIGINSCLKEYSMPKPRHSSYWRIAKYLHENPQITTIYIEGICRCVTAKDLYLMENTFLKDVKDNPDCLNGTFSGGRSELSDPDVWLVKKRKGVWFFYDPNKPHEPLPHFTQLRADGDVWKKKPPKNQPVDIPQ